MTSPDRFTIDRERTGEEVVGDGTPFVLCVDGRPIHERRTNGKTVLMTYYSERGANAALKRVQIDLPAAYVEKRR